MIHGSRSIDPTTGNGAVRRVPPAAGANWTPLSTTSGLVNSATTSRHLLAEDVAVESADIVLVENDPYDVVIGCHKRVHKVVDFRTTEGESSAQ